MAWLDPQSIGKLNIKDAERTPLYALQGQLILARGVASYALAYGGCFNVLMRRFRLCFGSFVMMLRANRVYVLALLRASVIADLIRRIRRVSSAHRQRSFFSLGGKFCS